MKNIKKSKNEEMKKNEKIGKIKSKKKDKKREKKKVGKMKRGLKVVPFEMGPNIDFSHKNCQEKS